MKLKEEFENLKNKYVKEYSDNHVFEVNFGRIWQHGQNGFSMLSAFKSERPLEDNMIEHKKLISDLKSKKLGFFEVDGKYVYKDGTISDELSVFVPYNPVYTKEEFKNIITQLIITYKQESALIGNLGEEGFYYLYQDGKLEHKGDRFSFDKMKQAYSVMKKGNYTGRTFTIEGVRVPQNHIQSYNLTDKGYLF